MKTAVIQLNARGNKEQNINTALLLVRRAIRQKAKFILLPEAFNFRGKINPKKGYKDIAEKVPGPSTLPLMALAKKHKVTILAGSVCERIPRGTKVFNTSVLIDTRGKLIARYRKMNLFDAKIGKTQLRESRHFRAGKTAKTSKAGPWTVGLSICYDLRFPQLYQKYARAGADVLCVPSAFTKMTGQAHWETLLRARAIENFSYVLAPAQIGKDSKGILSYGNSMIIDPWGKVLARASGNREKIIYARLDKKVLNRCRAVFPNRRKRKR